MPQVTLPDGRRLEFPDGMSDRQMRDAIESNFPEYKAQRQEALSRNRGVPDVDRPFDKDEYWAEEGRRSEQSLATKANRWGDAAARGLIDLVPRIFRGAGKFVTNEFTEEGREKNNKSAIRGVAQGWADLGMMGHRGYSHLAGKFKDPEQAKEDQYQRYVDVWHYVNGGVGAENHLGIEFEDDEVDEDVSTLFEIAGDPQNIVSFGAGKALTMSGKLTAVQKASATFRNSGIGRALNYRIGGEVGATRKALRGAIKGSAKAAELLGKATKVVSRGAADVLDYPFKKIAEVIEDNLGKSSDFTQLGRMTGKAGVGLAGVPVVGDVARAGYAARGVEMASSLGESLARSLTEPTRQKRFLQRVATDPDTPNIVRDAAALAHRYGGTAMTDVAFDMIADGVKGSVMESAITAASQGDIEEIGANAAVGAVFGGVAGAIGGPRGAGATQTQRLRGTVNAFGQSDHYMQKVSEKSLDDRLGKLHKPVMGALAAMWEAGIPVEPVFMTESETRAHLNQGGEESFDVLPAGWVNSVREGVRFRTDGKLYVNTDAAPNEILGVVLHEGGHHIFDALVETDPTLIEQIVPPGDAATVTLNGKAYGISESAAQFLADYNGRNPEIQVTDAVDLAHEIGADAMAQIFGANFDLTNVDVNMPAGSTAVALEASKELFKHLGLVDEDGTPIRADSPIGNTLQQQGPIRKALKNYSMTRLAHRQYKKMVAEESAKIELPERTNHSEAADLYIEDTPGATYETKEGKLLQQTAKVEQSDHDEILDFEKIAKDYYKGRPEGGGDFVGLGRGKEGARIPTGLREKFEFTARVRNMVDSIEDAIQRSTAIRAYYSSRSKRKGYNRAEIRNIVPWGLQVTKQGNVNVMGWDQDALNALISELKDEGLIRSEAEFRDRMEAATNRFREKKPIQDELVAAVFGADPDLIQNPKYKLVAKKTQPRAKYAPLKSFRLTDLYKYQNTGRNGFSVDYFNARNNFRARQRMRRSGPQNDQGNRFSPGRDTEGPLTHRRDSENLSSHVMLFAGGRNEHYGDHVWTLKSDLPDVSEAQDLIKYASEYYGVGLDEAKTFVDPDDIVDSAGAWDDAAFVSDVWQAMEAGEIKEVPGFRTQDGAVVLDKEGAEFDYHKEEDEDEWGDPSPDARFSPGRDTSVDSTPKDATKPRGPIADAGGREAIPVRHAIDEKGNVKTKKVEKTDADGNGTGVFKEIPIYEKVPYRLANSELINRHIDESFNPGEGPDNPIDLNDLPYKLTKNEKARLENIANSPALQKATDALKKEYGKMVTNEQVAAGKGWYSRMRESLKRALGEQSEFFTQLLGVTSARQAVEENFIQAYEAYEMFEKGKYNPLIKRYNEFLDLKEAGNLEETMLRRKIVKKSDLMKGGKKKPKAAIETQLRGAWVNHYNLVPKRPNGQKFGMNSGHVLKVLVGEWLGEVGSPKTPNFAGNLSGRTLRATIDVWAARTLRRLLYQGEPQWRIQPKSEESVSNLDFALGQMVFQKAADQIGINADDLQAIVWFGEKDVWDKMGWTGNVGALKGSFDQTFDVVFPEGQKPRSLTSVRNIVSYLRSERKVNAARDAGDPKKLKDALKNEEETRKLRGVRAYLKNRSGP